MGGWGAVGDRLYNVISACVALFKARPGLEDRGDGSGTINASAICPCAVGPSRPVRLARFAPTNPTTATTCCRTHTCLTKRQEGTI